MSDQGSTIEPDVVDRAPDRFTDIFYGMLVAPRQTLAVLIDENKYAHDSSALMMAGSLVLLSLVLAGMTRTGLDWHFGVMLRLGFLIAAGFFTWASLALLTVAFANVLGSGKARYSACLIATGWSFLPMVLSPIGSALWNIPFIGALVCLFLFFWFLYLEWSAASLLLGLDDRRMSYLVLIVPFLLSMIYAGALTTLIIVKI